VDLLLLRSVEISLIENVPQAFFGRLLLVGWAGERWLPSILTGEPVTPVSVESKLRRKIAHERNRAYFATHSIVLIRGIFIAKVR
jgi:hypothetical protein